MTPASPWYYLGPIQAEENLLPSGRDARGRMTALPPALRARQWAPGESGNPGGRGGLYHEVQRLAREASPSAVQRLIELAQLDRVDEEGKLLPLTSDGRPPPGRNDGVQHVDRTWVRKAARRLRPESRRATEAEVQPRPLHIGAATADRGGPAHHLGSTTGGSRSPSPSPSRRRARGQETDDQRICSGPRPKFKPALCTRA